MTGKAIIIFTADSKGRETLDFILPHGEDKEVHGYAPYSPRVLSLHRGEDNILQNKLQVAPGKLTTWGDRRSRRIIIRFQGEDRPLPGSY